MEELAEELQLVRTPTVIFRKDRHLASALVTSEIHYMFTYKNNPKALKKEHIQLLNDVGLSVVHPQYAYGWVMNNYRRLQRHNYSAELTTLYDIARRVTEVSVEDYTNVKMSLKVTIMDMTRVVYNVKTEFDNVFDKIVYSREFRQEWCMGEIKGCSYGNLHAIHLEPGKVLIITHSHLAGLRDMINSWFSILTYAEAHRNKYAGCNLYQHITHLINLMAGLNLTHPSRAADVLNSWPSLAIASILSHHEGSNTFLDSLKQGLEDVWATPLVQWFIRPPTSTAQVHLSLEISGLWKCFGHPIVDMDASVKNWLSTGLVLKQNLEPAGEAVLQMFTLTFCKNYYKEKRSWPPVTSTTKTSTRVIRNIASNTWDEDPRYPSLSGEFEGVVIGECLQFDMHVDGTDLLSDKSIIPERNQWIHEYDRQVHRTLYGRFPSGPRATTKSAVVAYLDKESVDVEEIIRTVKSGLIPRDWLVTVCVPKEREQKRTKARRHAKMTPEMRLYQTATESNLAVGVFPYIPQQTMTMGEEKLTRVISRMTSPFKDAYSQEFRYVVIDFSAWCTNHRYELCAPLFEALDRMFGLKGVYAFTHIFPMKSLLLFQDRFCPPQQDPLTGDPLPGPRCSHGAEGWQEGLRQKGWTIITIMLINRVAERCNTSATLIGQGDNQVNLIRIPPASYLHQRGLTPDTYLEWFVSELV